MGKTFKEVKEDMSTTQLICELKARIAQLEAVNELRSVPPDWMPQPNGDWIKDSQRNRKEYRSTVHFHKPTGHWLWAIATDNKGILWSSNQDLTVYVCQAMHNADEAFEKFLIS